MKTRSTFSTLKRVQTMVVMLFMSLLFSNSLFAQGPHHPHFPPPPPPPPHDSMPNWNDSMHVKIDSIFHVGHGGWMDSLHNWIDSSHVQWHDSGHVWTDTMHFPPPPPPPPPHDSGHAWNDSGHVWIDSSHMHIDSGFVHCDSGHTGNDSGFGGHFGPPPPPPPHGPHRLADPNSAVGEAVITIYPTPVAESALIHIENTSGNVTFSMFDVNGRLVMEKTLTNGDFQLDRGNFGAGLYFYQVNDGSTQVSNGRLIFQ